MANCTCKKLNCDSSCLCNCHREADDEVLDFLKGYFDDIDNAVNQADTQCEVAREIEEGI